MSIHKCKLFYRAQQHHLVGWVSSEQPLNRAHQTCSLSQPHMERTCTSSMGSLALIDGVTRWCKLRAMCAQVSVWNVETGDELVSLSAAIESHPLFCAFSHDGNKLAVTESNGSVLVWSTIAGCQWYQIFGAHHGKVGVLWLQAYVVVKWCSQYRIPWDNLDTAACNATYHMPYVARIPFNTYMLLPVCTSLRYMLRWCGYTWQVTSCSWSFDCRRLVTAGTDSMMAVWDAESGSPMYKFKVKSGPLTTCAVSSQVGHILINSSSPHHSWTG